jgi:glycine cleavage system aminomethyltransferase T
MNACRTEKGYCHWGHDIGIEDTPLEAGLGFTCAYDKPGGFIGRDAVLVQRDKGAPLKRLVQLKLENPNELIYHEEPIFVDGKAAGVVTSGMYGHRVNASLGMGYIKMPHPVTAEWLATAKVEVGVGERLVRAQAQLTPWYDPKGERVKA